MRSALLLLLLFVGCSSLSDTMNSWQSAPADALLRSWGPPAQIVRLDNGNRLFVYASSRTLWVPSASVVFLPTLSCRYQFEVDTRNRIIDWSYQGACR